MITTVISVLLCLSSFIFAAESLPKDLERVGVTEKIGTQLPLSNLIVTDSTGATESLETLLATDKPVLLSLVYFNCPMLCHLILDGLSQSLQEMESSVTEQFTVVSLSFDPDDTAAHAAKFKQRYTDQVGDSVDWRFLVAAPDMIQQITDSVGFNYRYVEETGEFVHGSALVALSPTGMIKRYLYGIEYDPFDLKMALLESGQTQATSVIDNFLLFCYTYDSDANSYVLQAKAVMRLTGMAIALAIILSIGYLSYSNRRIKL